MASFNGTIIFYTGLLAVFILLIIICIKGSQTNDSGDKKKKKKDKPNKPNMKTTSNHSEKEIPGGPKTKILTKKGKEPPSGKEKITTKCKRKKENITTNCKIKKENLTNSKSKEEILTKPKSEVSNNSSNNNSITNQTENLLEERETRRTDESVSNDENQHNNGTNVSSEVETSTNTHEIISPNIEEQINNETILLNESSSTSFHSEPNPQEINESIIEYNDNPLKSEVKQEEKSPTFVESALQAGTYVFNKIYNGLSYGYSYFPSFFDQSESKEDKSTKDDSSQSNLNEKKSETLNDSEETEFQSCNEESDSNDSVYKSTEDEIVN